MAEFCEVMKQKMRMCDYIKKTYSYKCSNCGLSVDNNHVLLCGLFMEQYPDESEKIIMDWAKEHPEPQYPTWEEWQNDNFPNASNIFTACTFMNYREHRCPNYGGHCVGIATCHTLPIPSDIAEKLGIKPKG